MSQPAFSDEELLAYVDELLPIDQTAAVEKALRQSSELRQRTAVLARRRDQGGHSVGEIWRRQRLSCPARSVLGSYLLGVLDRETASYLQFHLETVGCRYCAANLLDLQQAQQSQAESGRRQRRIFESSVGHWEPSDH